MTNYEYAKARYAEIGVDTEAAIALYNTPPLCKKLVSRMMRTDFSWKNSAEKYLAMYESLS